jgi:N-acetylglucosaminyldiphosphoundecaprenol N-acetyl-beta-D-mannosaminyltransferase
MRVNFLSCPIDLLSIDEIFEKINDSISGKSKIRVEGVNVAKLVQSSKDIGLSEALQDAELVHVDGFGIELGMRLSGMPLKNRIAGIDLMLKICEFSVLSDSGIYLLGASQNVLEGVKEKLLEKIPGIKISGSGNGYFLPEQEPRVVADIQNSQAKILFIGMSSPKKELFIQNYWAELKNIQIAMGVGGSFDVISGRLKRAPKWMQNSGLEWVFRLIQEPRRLFARYALTNTQYLFLLVKGILCSKN